jgi:hypothetical protein
MVFLLSLIVLIMSLFVFRSLFVEMGKGEKPDTVDSCCPIKMKTGTHNAQLDTTILTARVCPRVDGCKN